MKELKKDNLKDFYPEVGQFVVRNGFIFVDTVKLSQLNWIGRGRFSEVYSVPNAPVLVKRIKTLLRAEGYDYGFRYTLEDFRREVVDPLQAIQDPANGLAQYIACAVPVWGKDEKGESCGFLITEKVEGEEISNVRKIDGETAVSLDQLLAASLAMTVKMGTLPDGFVIKHDIFKLYENGWGYMDNLRLGKNGVFLYDVYPLKRHPKNYSYEKDKSAIMLGVKYDLPGITDGYSYPITSGMVLEYLQFMKEWSSN